MREQKLISGIEIIWYFVRMHSQAIKKPTIHNPTKHQKRRCIIRTRETWECLWVLKWPFFHFKGVTGGWL